MNYFLFCRESSGAIAATRGYGSFLSRSRGGLWAGENAGGGLIAIVDDDEWVRRSLERLVRAEGFRVESFGSAEAFIEFRNRAAISCIVLDVGLPGMNGFDLQRYLGQQGCHIPVVFVSARGEAMTQALQIGAVGFFEKPFNNRDLLDCIHTVMPSKQNSFARRT